MNIDPLAKNDIIARWKNHQSVRRIAKDLHLGRAAIASVIRQHLVQTQSPPPDSPQSESAGLPPACFGPARLTRKSKLDPFLDPLTQLLDRYPNITAQRAFVVVASSSSAISWVTPGGSTSVLPNAKTSKRQSGNMLPRSNI